ncbi:hypothetical protein [Streptomyces sp. NPDC004721]
MNSDAATRKRINERWVWAALSGLSALAAGLAGAWSSGKIYPVAKWLLPTIIVATVAFIAAFLRAVRDESQSKRGARLFVELLEPPNRAKVPWLTKVEGQLRLDGWPPETAASELERRGLKAVPFVLSPNGIWYLQDNATVRSNGAISGMARIGQQSWKPQGYFTIVLTLVDEGRPEKSDHEFQNFPSFVTEISPERMVHR